MSIVAVTGPAGHVGANLVRALLARGDQVRALVHHDTQALDGLDVEMVSGDVGEPDSLRRAFAGAEMVYHTAVYISLAMHEWPRLEAVNVQGARNVAQACLESGVRRLVHLSSVEALVDGPSSTPVDETRPLVESRRYSLYARSKAAGEKEVRQAMAQGLDAVILYPTAILGPHDHRLGFANSGLLGMATGKLWALVDGGFDWVDVRDVAVGALQAAARAPAGGRYILAGHRASLRDLAGVAEEVSGTKAPRLVFPMGLARLVAPLGALFGRLTGTRPLFTPAALRPLRSNPRISHARATHDLDYQPRPLLDTVTDTVEWFAARGLMNGKGDG